MPRRSGILLHPTSLPGRFGIGEIGPAAFRFVDFLAETGQSVWQVLPLGPSGYGASPYSGVSAFAGNPLLVSLDRLIEDGLLRPADVAGEAGQPTGDVDYPAVEARKRSLLWRAFERFEVGAPSSARDDFLAFRRSHAHWLDDFALFAAQKEASGGAAWPHWEAGLVVREPDALERRRGELAREIRGSEFVQYLFFTQWGRLRAYCHERRVSLMGDVPIFVAHDSADVWAHPRLFTLGADGFPSFVAGVPPDYFSATGQLWGTPLYRWDVLAREGFGWWIERFRTLLGLVDEIRVDHFRGFEAHFEIPAGASTAEHGRWDQGPGAAFFEAVGRALGPLLIIAENLGIITPAVEELRERFGFPGMAVLQFAFGDESPANAFLPYNYGRNLVVYTGTHDNDTTVGWWSSGTGKTTRRREEVERERDFCLRYLGSDGSSIHWDLIRCAMASPADTAMFPLQDVLGLGSEARMNLPGRPDGNWRWRYAEEALTAEVRERLGTLTRTYGRAT